MVRLFESMSIVDLFMVTCQRISFSKPIFDGLTYGGLILFYFKSLFSLMTKWHISIVNLSYICFLMFQGEILLIASNTAIGKLKQC